MNFYLLSVFGVLCFGRWTVAGEPHRQPLTKNSAEVTEEWTKRLKAEARSPIIEGLVQVASQARTWIQRLRRLLKTLRKWCASHPFEVKLGKCFVGYLKVKIPGLGQRGKVARDDEDPGGAESPWKTSKNATSPGRALALLRPGQKRAFADGLLEKSFLFLYSRDFLTRVGTRLRHYRDALFGDNLAVCLWDYSWKKFWIWVDSTPDP